MIHMRALGNKTYCGRRSRNKSFLGNTVWALETHREITARYPVGERIVVKSTSVHCSICRKDIKDLLNIKRFRLSVLQGRVRVGMEKGWMDDTQYGFLDDMSDEEVVNYDSKFPAFKLWEVINTHVI